MNGERREGVRLSTSCSLPSLVSFHLSTHFLIAKRTGASVDGDRSAGDGVLRAGRRAARDEKALCGYNRQPVRRDQLVRSARQGN